MPAFLFLGDMENDDVDMQAAEANEAVMVSVSYSFSVFIFHNCHLYLPNFVESNLVSVLPLLNPKP